jgi:hypothetical protein
MVRARLLDTLLALAFGDEHLEDLPAPADQLCEQPRGFVRDPARLGFYSFGKAGDDKGIDGIALGPLADRLREVPHLRRIHHRQRQPGSSNCRRHDRLKATGRLYGDQRRRERPQPLDQLFQTLAVPCNPEGFSARQRMNVQPVLRNVNANKDRVHLHPSLRNRARVAAPATVRVRWNGGRSPALRNGLFGPRMTRSPVRHRTGQSNRFGDS